MKNDLYKKIFPGEFKNTKLLLGVSLHSSGRIWVPFLYPGDDVLCEINKNDQRYRYFPRTSQTGLQPPNLLSKSWSELGMSALDLQ